MRYYWAVATMCFVTAGVPGSAAALPAAARAPQPLAGQGIASLDTVLFCPSCHCGKTFLPFARFIDPASEHRWAWWVKLQGQLGTCTLDPEGRHWSWTSRFTKRVPPRSRPTAMPLNAGLPAFSKLKAFRRPGSRAALTIISSHRLNRTQPNPRTPSPNSSL